LVTNYYPLLKGIIKLQGNRIERLGSLIQELISALILENRIKDPRISPFVR
jgi:hypothetical protein